MSGRGPHSGPYSDGAPGRVRYADRRALAATMIKAATTIPIRIDLDDESM